VSDLVPSGEAWYEDSGLSPEQLAERYAGTYSTGWGMLKSAALSSLLGAAERASSLIKTLENTQRKSKSPGEVSFIMLLNYRLHLLGPSMSAVVLSAFSLESFLRLCCQFALEEKRPRSARRKGLPRESRESLQAFDRLSIPGKIRRLRELLGQPSVGEYDAAVARADELARYRNELAHDTPILVKDALVYERPAGPAMRPTEVDERLGRFERPGLSNRPTRLKHALAAAGTHDEIVRLLLDERLSKELATALGRADSAMDRTIAGSLPNTAAWEKLQRLSDYWEESVEPALECSLEELERVGRDLRRRAVIKPVD
jgi:hypothetical protein